MTTYTENAQTNPDEATQEAPDLDITAPVSPIETPELNLDYEPSEAVPEPQHEEGSEDKQTHRVAHLRKIERQSKAEIAELNKKLADSQSQLLEYTQLFNATYANGVPAPQQHEVPQSPASNQALTEEGVMNILQRHEEEKNRITVQQHQESEAASLKDDWVKNMTQTSHKYADFQDMMDEKGHQFSEALVNASMYLPNAGEVIYALAKNPQELQRINGLSIQQQVKTLAQHSNKIASKQGVHHSTSSPSPLSNNLKNKPGGGTSPYVGKSAAEIRKYKQANNMR